ncbi:hypothetical protein QWY14_11205 [Planococcus sp. N028]|uniref:Amino acid transporter n=1 Tax=Planococcus shixiaomingii TaxID=3058393 RepID=A0ABT8N3A4_9BACL|nr:MULTISPECIES: hypothetical protein [unclassified Planococcus (in: firmicutes)]MDN7242371.1 hypothetical protein [Planococcus sp. N028]WKA54612.1 hypothetical protein QWY21_18400 [Planococcus sp. N022]
MAFEQCQQIHACMSDFHSPWFIAGGWAIDLFLGKETRSHSDIEIGIFRDDQETLKAYLSGWSLKKAVKGQLEEWDDGFLALPIHEIHGWNQKEELSLEILLNEREAEHWKFRRDRAITRSLQSVWSFTASGIPYLSPEIVLLYKVKNTQEKDESDFFAVLDFLNEEKKRWLYESIKMHKPEHPWANLLMKQE